MHSARLMAALAKLKLDAWAYPGPIGLVERDDFLDVEEVHVVDGWRYLGTARGEAEIHQLLEPTGQSGSTWTPTSCCGLNWRRESSRSDGCDARG